jgi:hypothetical protein
MSRDLSRDLLSDSVAFFAEALGQKLVAFMSAQTEHLARESPVGRKCDTL